MTDEDDEAIEADDDETLGEFPDFDAEDEAAADAAWDRIAREGESEPA